MQKIIITVMLLTAYGAGSLFGQQAIGTFELQGSHLKVQGPLLGFEASTQSTHEAATGMASGKRQHNPITIIRVADGSSPVLQQAVVTDEVLKTVTIQLDKASDHRNGYLTIKLTNAVISKISLLEGGAAGNRQLPSADPLEEISIVYESIQYEYRDGKAVFKDDWTARR